MHGDSLCTADTEYLGFRAMVRSPDWQRDFLAKSPAERNAIFSAFTHGEREILAVATVSKASTSCGACRQLILEFGVGDTPIYSVCEDPAHGKERLIRTSISRLMPRAHTGKTFGFKR